MTREPSERSRLRHDLRGPLNTIGLTLEVTRRRLEKSGRVDGAVAAGLDRMRDELERLEELIRTRLADPDRGDHA